MKIRALVLVFLLAGCISAPNSQTHGPQERLGDLAGLGSDWYVRYEIDGRASFEMKAVGVQNVPLLGEVVVVEISSQNMGDLPNTVYFATVPLAVAKQTDSGLIIDFLNAEAPFVSPFQAPFLAHVISSEIRSWRYLVPAELAESNYFPSPPQDGVFAYPGSRLPEGSSQPWIRYEFDGRLLPARMEIHNLRIPHAFAQGAVSEWVRTDFDPGTSNPAPISPEEWLQPLPGMSAVPFPQLGSSLGTSLTDAMAAAAEDHRVANFMERGQWWVTLASYQGFAVAVEDRWLIKLASDGSDVRARFSIHGLTGELTGYEEELGRASAPPFGLSVPNLGSGALPGQGACALRVNPAWSIGYTAQAAEPDPSLSQRRADVRADFYSIADCGEPSVQTAMAGGRYGLMTKIVVD